MNEVNKTLFIPLYGKALISRKGIILSDPDAEKIWDSEAFPIKGKSKSKWLAYNMAMRARVFDDWTESMLEQKPEALVLHVGCGLDSRCRRVKAPYKCWYDCDFPDVIDIRRKYYGDSDSYHMQPFDATNPEMIEMLPDSDVVIVVFEGISMYMSREQLHDFFEALEERYPEIHVLMDVYTELGAKASKYKNPVNDVGVTRLYGYDDPGSILEGLKLKVKAEHSFTPPQLVEQLKGVEKAFFKLLFTGKMYGKIYRLFELN
jgi:O-methyltransferase involved in polyketide biosynthesis